jgi:hypothetical protein
LALRNRQTFAGIMDEEDVKKWVSSLDRPFGTDLSPKLWNMEHYPLTDLPWWIYDYFFT